MTTATPAAALDRWMGPFCDPSSRVSAVESARADAEEAFPEDAWLALEEFGLARYYVPAEHGGGLHSLPELLALWQAVARRDLTLAVAHGKTFLGAISVWVGGTPAQAAELAQQILDGAIVSWGLTERDHGSDLIASEVRVSESQDRWRLDGEKWLINNATRGRFLCALVRSEPEPGPRGLSVVLVDKHKLQPDQHYPLPKERTHGIRGADISGIGFRGAELASSSFVGSRGRGLDIVLRSLQVTRILCSALSLGAGQHALQIAETFARERRVHGRILAELPLVRRTLERARATLLAAEAISMLAARSIHALPKELFVISAVTKALVPALIEDLLQDLRGVLGLRSFLTSELAEGHFQKIERDHRIVPIFDGSTLVNQNAVVSGFPALARDGRGDEGDRAGVEQAARLDAPLGPWSARRQRIVPSSTCSFVQGLPGALGTIRASPDNLGLSDHAMTQLGRLERSTDEILRQITEAPPPERIPSARDFDLADGYGACLAAAGLVHVWLHNPEQAALQGNRSAWLEQACGVLLDRIEARS